MRQEVQNQIKMLGRGVAAEVAPRRDTHRRWLWLGPAEQGQPPSPTAPVRLRDVEAPAGADVEDWPTPSQDPSIMSYEVFESLDVALEALAKRGIVTDDFDAIWKTENPF